ncbi:MAG: aldo/keto reductase [Lachnospiraceae bacterium]|nr:aldo/keto reductase [Lachnospiraceae bacterium]
MIDNNEINSNKLGFGLMRLPHKGLGIDISKTCQMVDLFMEAGLTYFDTAFVYQGSEEAIRKALVERYPRESYTLATKLFVTMAPTEKLAKKEFETSLKRTGAGYFDYYLLHALSKGNYKKYEKFHLWDFVKEEKAKGRIKHYGFSFHDGPELLDEILTEHPDVEFVQLQINYQDWENPGVQSRANYEVARKHGKPIVVMEPVKGGGLANPPKAVQELFKAVNPDASFASWAIRFVASLDGILAVLSGMSNVEQMKDNLSYMKDFKPLNEQEKEAIRKAQEILNSVKSIPCTACHYCTEGCPKKIPIPEIFAARNKQLIWGQIEEGKADYQIIADSGHGIDSCIGCGQCEKVCPQKISVIRQLKENCADFLIDGGATASYFYGPLKPEA